QLENHSRNPKEAQRQISFAPGCPRFSKEDWKSVLVGDYVDLDGVLRHLQPGQTSGITDLASWQKAWHTFKRAIDFAFTDRGSELQKYEDYILRAFNSRSSSWHSQVISFDRDNRQNVMAQDKDVRFSDVSEFEGNKDSWLAASG
ncbi:hypothetical protein BDZ89DRAFT_936546, partial [Hymenopellis radicata]